jgi:hypothetical protein
LKGKLEVARTAHRGREAVLLSNGEAEAIVCLRGGMVPVFSIRRPSGSLNAHWIPPFRSEGGEPYSEAEHGSFWKSPLLYELAGDFLCSPNFGPDCRPGGVSVPAHGWTANQAWRLLEAAVLPEAGASGEGAAYARFGLDSPDPHFPLSWERTDLVFGGQSAFFSSTLIRNSGDRAVSINVGRHATVGPSLLEQGCRLSASADRFATPPGPSEFSDTGRLAEGAEFESLSAAPLRSGSVADITLVPGMIGFTDLVSGSVPHNAELGWSCVANPRLGLAHLALFPGPAGLPTDEIALGFNTIWMQYGGRPFTPWAETEGGRDRSFCLGSECATGAFANGLEYSLEHPSLLGSPTTVAIPARGEKRLLYCTALVPLKIADMGDGPISAALGDGGGLVLKGAKSAQETGIDASFGALRSFVAGSRG